MGVFCEVYLGGLGSAGVGKGVELGEGVTVAIAVAVGVCVIEVGPARA